MMNDMTANMVNISTRRNVKKFTIAHANATRAGGAVMAAMAATSLGCLIFIVFIFIVIFVSVLVHAGRVRSTLIRVGERDAAPFPVLFILVFPRQLFRATGA